MTGIEDPGRLFDESDSELERTLLGVARAEKCSPRARTKTLAALGITGSALSAAAVTAAAVAADRDAAVGRRQGIAWVKVVLGLSALGAVAIAPPVYRAWQLRHANPPPAARTGVPASMSATGRSRWRQRRVPRPRTTQPPCARRWRRCARPRSMRRR